VFKVVYLYVFINVFLMLIGGSRCLRACACMHVYLLGICNYFIISFCNSIRNWLVLLTVVYLCTTKCRCCVTCRCICKTAVCNGYYTDL